MPGSWQVARGETLLELQQSGELRSELPVCSAVYLWKWNLRPRGTDATTPSSISTWISFLLDTPRGDVQDARLGHFLRINSIEITGPQLDQRKKRVLEVFAEKRANRQWLRHYIEDLASHSTTLYTGETGNLPLRIHQHIGGDTDFGKTVTEHPSLAWEALDLHYYNLGEPTSGPTEIRKALEYVTAIITLSGYTRRPG